MTHPVLAVEIRRSLDEIVAEHSTSLLVARGLTPTRTVLFTGEPGTGKTMAARWLASRIGRTLLTLDLAQVMSDELGQSAQNLTEALNFAESSDSVLFIDEFDSIASERGNINDVGEVRRLVNVLLTRLDEWADGHLLIAATNHPQLLDRAIDRRFEVKIEIPLPDHDARAEIAARVLPCLSADDAYVLGTLTDGLSGSDISTYVLRALRHAALDDRPADFPDVLRQLAPATRKLDKPTRDALIVDFDERGMSSRKIGELVNVSHVTVREVLNAQSRPSERASARRRPKA